jgi:hypothetical protein
MPVQEGRPRLVLELVGNPDRRTIEFAIDVRLRVVPLQMAADANREVVGEGEVALVEEPTKIGSE